MSLGFDMDGEPILTEEEKRDEFVEIICAQLSSMVKKLISFRNFL